MTKTSIVVLAAGSSSRFGSSKQLLPFQNKTLLQQAIDEAIESGAAPVIVVAGANDKEVVGSIHNRQSEIVLNRGWKQGMASSIVAGVRKAAAMNSGIERIIITVCDQPFVSSFLFQELYKKQAASAKGIVACRYAGTVGTPVLFTQNYFTALLNLRGDEGAKKILLANRNDVETIGFEKGQIDIDTKDDYRKLLNK